MINRSDELQKWFDDKLHSDGYVYFNDLLKEVGFPVNESQKYWKYVLDPISGKTSLINDNEVRWKDRTCKNCEYRDLHGQTIPCFDCQEFEEWAPRVDMHLRAYGG